MPEDNQTMLLKQNIKTDGYLTSAAGPRTKKSECFIRCCCQSMGYDCCQNITTKRVVPLTSGAAPPPCRPAAPAAAAHTCLHRRPASQKPRWRPAAQPSRKRTLLLANGGLISIKCARCSGTMRSGSAGNGTARMAWYCGPTWESTRKSGILRTRSRIFSTCRHQRKN